MTMTATSTATSSIDGSVDEPTDWVATARRLGTDLEPGVADRDRDGAIAIDGFQQLRGSGLSRALVPVEFGGGGASHEEMGGALRELARHDPATAVAFSMHAHVLGAQVWRHHHGLDASGVFAKVVDGAILISTGASDWVGSTGTARRVDGGYRVSARKGPASACEVGQILVTSIRWEDAPDGPQVLHCAVPFSADGVRIDPTWDTLGMRATGSHTVVLDDVFVPDAAVSLVRPADQWAPVWNTVLGVALPLIMAAYLGIADRAVELATASAAGRSEPHVFQLVGEMMNAYTTATDTVAAMFAASGNFLFANTDDHAARTLGRKTVAADALIETVRLAIEVAGGYGYTRQSDLERLYRDIHGCLFHPLGRAKQTQFSGRVALGVSPI
jgi:alkylation response protein AidB-like acyl-CoA dehydrogenase